MLIPFIVLVLLLSSVVSSYYIGRNSVVPINIFQQEPAGDDLNQLLNFIDLSSYEVYAQGIKGIKQGILVVNKDKKVEQTLSPMTAEILENVILNQPIVDILFYKDEEEKESVTGILDRIFTAIDDEERQTFIELLPDHAKIVDRILGLSYYFPEHSKYFYVYIEDQSALIEQAAASDRRLKQLEMVTKALSQISEYSEVIISYEHFVQSEIPKWCHESTHMLETLSRIRQKIHSYKLEFKKFDMYLSLEQLELFDMELRALPREMTPMELLEEIEHKRPYTFIEEEVTTISMYQKEELLQSNYLAVDVNVIHEIENMLSKLPESHEKQALIERFIRIKHVSIQDVIKRFDKYAKDFAVSMNKKINPIIFEGYNVYFDENVYKDLIKGFVELVGNAIEHGIEFPTDRFRNNKAEYGTLKLTVSREGADYLLRFEDDGRGVDVNKVKDMLYDYQVLPFDDLVALDDDAVAQFIFREGLTTNQLAKSNTSKGMGLFMLKEKLEQMGGGIKVHTVFNSYTVFEIRVPSSEKLN